MNENMKKRQFRQGDVLIEYVDNIPTDAAPIQAESGRNIMARGEATGHHHSTASGSSALLSTLNRDMYLLVQEGDALLEHQEHAAIRIPVGNYRVTIQREYSPAEIRNVKD